MRHESIENIQSLASKSCASRAQSNVPHDAVWPNSSVRAVTVHTGCLPNCTPVQTDTTSNSPPNEAFSWSVCNTACNMRTRNGMLRLCVLPLRLVTKNIEVWRGDVRRRHRCTIHVYVYLLKRTTAAYATFATSSTHHTTYFHNCVRPKACVSFLLATPGFSCTQPAR